MILSLMMLDIELLDFHLVILGSVSSDFKLLNSLAPFYMNNSILGNWHESESWNESFQ